MPNVFRNKKVEEGLDESVRVAELSRDSSGTGQHTAGEHGNRMRTHTPVPSENATAKAAHPSVQKDEAETSGHGTAAAASRQGDATAARDTEEGTPASHINTDETRVDEAPSYTQRTEQTGADKHKNKLGGVLGGDFLSRGWVRKQRGLLLLFVLFAIAMVSNRYYVEHLTKEKLATEENIKFLGEQRIQMKRDCQDNVRISNIVARLDSIGIGIIAGPPYELYSPRKKKR